MIRPHPLLLALALCLPLAGSWVYFDLLAGSPWARAAYLTSKGLQLLLPLWVFLAYRDQRRFDSRPHRPGRSFRHGLLQGLFMAAGIGVAYLLLREELQQPAILEALYAKTEDFQLHTVREYWIFALLLSTVHSLFEEVYWRWMVFSGLSVFMRWPLAALVSSIAFAAHHFLVLTLFLPDHPWWSRALPAALSVAFAGYLWCRLYRRHGSLLGPWISHLLVDAALMGCGYLILFKMTDNIMRTVS